MLECENKIENVPAVSVPTDVGAVDDVSITANPKDDTTTTGTATATTAASGSTAATDAAATTAPPHHYTLFVGDLSIFCGEDDLREAFVRFGDVLEAKIIRCEETKKNLSYGFVKFSDREAAATAIDSLNGTLLCGRPLRIGWATRRSRHEYDAPPAAPQRNHGERSSVHVSYSSEQTDDLVTEQDLRRVFSNFGEVVDVTVKKFEINEVSYANINVLKGTASFQ